MRLTGSHRTWGFGLIFRYPRIKADKRLVRDKAAALTVPGGINEVWLMDFMHDTLDGGRVFRLVNVL
jgi:putative transposase